MSKAFYYFCFRGNEIIWAPGSSKFVNKIEWDRMGDSLFTYSWKGIAPNLNKSLESNLKKLPNGLRSLYYLQPRDNNLEVICNFFKGNQNR